MALDEPKENDLKLEIDGYKFVLDAALEKTYGKFTVDYSNWFLNRGFDISHRRTF